METADQLNAVSPTVLSPVVLAPTSNMKLGDSIEALSISSQGEGNILVHQHSQASAPSEMLPLCTSSTLSNESAWMKQQ
jgi:hypothetical protein